MKKKAAEIATTFEKQGMSAANAMKKAWQQITDDAVRGSTKTKTSVYGIKAAFSSLGSTVSRLGGLLTSVLGPVSFVWLAKECIELGSSVNEVQNVVDTAFGSMAYKMEAFADTAISSFGISELAAKKTGSTFMAMAKGIGMAEVAASDMAIALTGLSGDVASFYNISQDEAATKLKSVFTGETETLKELGVVMTQTNLEQYALSKGISKSISTMTQAELTMLRYHFVLDSLNLTSGDFVKTQDSWANQTRILSMRMQELGTNVGQILTTVLLPAVKTLNEILEDLVSATSIISAAISSIFGVQISQNSQIASTADEAAKAENNLAAGISNAAKAAKKSLASFDELNILQSSTDGGSGGGGSSGFDMSISNNTSVTPGEELDTEQVEKVAEIIKKIADYVPIIAAGLAGWKLGSFIADLLIANTQAGTLKETLGLIAQKAGLTIGITLAVVGIALEAQGIADAIENGLNGINFSKILGGGGILAAGGALIGQFFGSTVLGAAIASIIAGIPMYITGIYDAVKNGIDWLNGSLISLGATLAGAGIGAIIGTLAGGPGIGTLIGAGIGVVVGLLTDFYIWFWQKFDEIEAWILGLPTWLQVMVRTAITVSGGFGTTLITIIKKWDELKQFFADLWQGISSLASECWEAIVDFFSPAIEWFSQLFSSVYQTLSDIFYNIGVIASGCWEVIKAVWAVVSDWFDTNIIQPMSTYFSDLWSGFLDAASDAWEGVKEVFGKVGSFFKETFEDAWQGIVDVFSVAGEIFTDIKDGILASFKVIVNGLISGINNTVTIPFNGINSALGALRGVSIFGIQPFAGLRTISVPQIPYLAQGAVLPPNKPFLAMVGDQTHGTNVEAPLSTIQEAVALVMEDMIRSNIAGHEATVAVLKDILEAVLGIEIGDSVIGEAVSRYNSKMAIIRGVT